MNRDRLQEFELLLRNLHAKVPTLTHFYMGSWFIKHFHPPAINDAVTLNSIDKNECGTAACALGAAGLYKPFRDQGLKTKKTEGLVYYGTRSGIFAGMVFFDLTYGQSCWLFLPQNYAKSFRADRHNPATYLAGRTPRVTPEMVARRIRKIINGTAPELR